MINENKSYINVMETTKNEFRIHYIGDKFDIKKVINPKKIAKKKS